MSRIVDTVMSKGLKTKSARVLADKKEFSDMTLGGRIKIQMAAHGIKGASALAARLSKELGVAVHRQKVQKWINDEVSNIELDALFALADVLECSARWLSLRKGGPQKAVQLDVERTRAIVLYDNLDKHEGRGLVDKWLRQGHDLLEVAELTPTKAVPFKSKETMQ